MKKTAFFWFRRDLRLHDNAGLYHALKNEKSVQPVFIFDQLILDKLEDKSDARVHFLHKTIAELDRQLQALGSGLKVIYGKPIEVWADLLKENREANIYCNRDYESYAIQRDKEVSNLVTDAGGQFHSFKDHVIFDRDEIVKDDQSPYLVFTPYKRKWLAKLDTHSESGYYFKSYPCDKYKTAFAECPSMQIPSLKEMGFEASEIPIPSIDVSQKIIKQYDADRDFPARNGTSRLGLHFRFGTISIRAKARKAQKLNETYLSELIWRDFYSMILQHYPHVEKSAFRKKYEAIPWINDEAQFEHWKAGTTGYPIVDAGMRELNQTGHMHNRVRMVVASFLTKHLLIDWRWGEAYFAEKLLDFDLASNNGGWQWAAGCGTDAAPYFRIFNPISQQKRFDPKFEYINKWVPEFGTEDYPDPIVDHKEARVRCLDTYKLALDNN